MSEPGNVRRAKFTETWGAVFIGILVVALAVYAIFTSFAEFVTASNEAVAKKWEESCPRECPEPEPCPRCDKPCMCSADQLHRLEVNLYGLHNQLGRTYDHIGEAIEEIQTARGVVTELSKTDWERWEEERWRQLYDDAGLKFDPANKALREKPGEDEFWRLTYEVHDLHLAGFRKKAEALQEVLNERMGRP